MKKKQSQKKLVILSVETHKLLSELTPKSLTYDQAIHNLLKDKIKKENATQ